MSKSNSLQNSKVFVMRGNVIDIAVGVIIGGHLRENNLFNSGGHHHPDRKANRRH